VENESVRRLDGKRVMRSLTRNKRMWTIVATLSVVLVSVPAQAQDLQWDADAVYSIDAGQGLLHLEAELVLTNLKPNTRSGDTITQYFYEGIEVHVPEEAVNLSITTDGASLDYRLEASEGEDFEGFQLASIDFERNLFYKQSTTVLIEYDLPGDPPRGDTAFRVNPAYVFFPAFAWGDPGGTTMSIVLPSDFEIEVFGAGFETVASGEQTTYAITEFDDPEIGSVLVQAWNPPALTSTRAMLETCDVEIRAWPDDPFWEEEVLGAVQRGLPVLGDLVGLEWDPATKLVIVESQDVSLAGYGGWYLGSQDRIEIGEWVDPALVLHELSHYWFDGSLFEERWIVEGLAEAFSVTAADRAGLEVPDEGRPSEIHHRPSWAQDLNEWVTPDFEGPVDDQVEEYGYEASAWLIQRLIDEIGIGAMADVVAAAANDEIAYRGDPDPEQVARSDDWRRFLDLVEEVGGSNDASGLFEEYVTSDDLFERAAAREEYEELGFTGWDAPFYVRTSLSSWAFPEAMNRISEAFAILDTRDAIASNAEKIGVAAPASLEVAYESATADMSEAAGLATSQLVSSEEVLEAKDIVEAERDLLTRVGLVGEDVDLEYAQAVDAFAADDLERANAEAQEVIELIEAADDVGGTRLLVGFAIVIGAIGVVFAVVLYRRRHSRAVIDSTT
jgi:hypothetical protein